MSLVIYTDGAYSPARNRGGIGIVFTKDNKVIATHNDYFDNVTNNQMELYAVIKALVSVINIKNPVKIITDSQYVYGCANLNWERKKNINLWKVYDAVSSKFPNLELEWVKGHEDSKFNNLADELAVSATQCINDSKNELKIFQ